MAAAAVGEEGGGTEGGRGSRAEGTGPKNVARAAKKPGREKINKGLNIRFLQGSQKTLRRSELHCFCLDCQFT